MNPLLQPLLCPQNCENVWFFVQLMANIALKQKKQTKYVKYCSPWPAHNAHNELQQQHDVWLGVAQLFMGQRVRGEAMRLLWPACDV